MILHRPEVLVQPHGATVVWRYMSMQKFRDLLRHRALFFANAATLRDQYEVTLPQESINAKERELSRSGLAAEVIEHEMRRFLWIRKPRKNLTLVSCWSLRREESYALWKVYVGPRTPGVAIRTTVTRLLRSIVDGGDPHPETFYAGKVRYRTYLSDAEQTRFHMVCTKKPYYDFESEFRCFILHETPAGAARAHYNVAKGRRVHADMTQLVKTVVVTPFASATLRSQVELLVRAAGLSVPVLSSAILDE